MWQARGISAVVGVAVAAGCFSALAGDTSVWSFVTPSDYAYDTNKLEVVGGVARLKTVDQVDDDNSAYGFNGGAHGDTQWDAVSNRLELTPAGRVNGTGVFTSRVFGVGVAVPWSSLALTPSRPAAQPLPDNAGAESGYPEGNVTMAGNRLLLHMNEASGVVSDTSGQGNHGAATGGVVYSVSGRYGTGLNFDGSNSFLTVTNPPSGGLNAANCALEAWINTAGLPGSHVKGTDNGAVLARHQAGPQVNGYELGINSDEQPYFAYEDVAAQNWVKYDNTLGTYLSGSPAGNGRLPLGTFNLGDDAAVYSPTVIKEGSLYRMWYAGGDGTNYRMYYATSTNGVEWTKGNTLVPTNSDSACTDGRVSLGSNGRGDDVGVYGGTVLKDDDGTYKMWYSGYDGATFRIFLGTSSDGLTWTKVDNSTNVPVSNTTSSNGCIPLGLTARGDDAGTLYPFVMKEGGVYQMWYTGYDGANYRIYRATSPDGLNWTKTDNTIPAPSDGSSTGGRVPLGSNLLGDDAGVLAGYVVKTGGVYQMWYTGYDSATYRIYRATSPDGLIWTKTDNTIPAASDGSSSNGRVPIAATAGRGDVSYVGYGAVLLDDDGTYKMWYSGYNVNWRGYYATSPDGLVWTKMDNTLPLTGDAAGISMPWVIKDGGVYKMWYSGYNGANWRIYYATSTNGLMWQKFNNANIVTTANGLCTNGIILLGSAGRGDDVAIYSPCVLKEGGLYRMWYSGYDNTVNPIYYGIFYASSTDGVNWVKLDNFISAISDGVSTNGRIYRGSALLADSYGAFDPCVIKEGNTYRMWYAGTDNTNQRVCYATSPDGLTWTKYDNTIQTSNDVTGTNGRIPLGVTGADVVNIRVPRVFRDGDIFKMLYAGYVGSNYRIYMASSPDGLTWTKYDNSIPAINNTTGTRGRIPLGTAGRVDDTIAMSGRVLKDGSVYKIWYSTYGSTPAAYRIAYATMTVGLTASNAVSTGAWHHLVGTVDGGVTRLYVDGALVASGLTAVAAVTNAATLRVGDMFKGALDELAIYNRALTDDEVRDRYRRGANRIRAQMRTSSSSPPASEFIGPDGTTNSWWTEAVNPSNTPPVFALTNVAGNAYFQYRIRLETDSTTLPPGVKEARVGPEHFAGDDPALVTLTPAPTFAALTVFNQTLGVGNQGTVRYQFSPNGASWYYHNGTAWVAASGYGQANTAAEAQGAIASFGAQAGSGVLQLKVYYHSAAGMQAVEVDELSVESWVAPAAPVGVAASDGVYPNKVFVSWNPGSNAVGYTVWRYTANTTNLAGRLGSTAATAYDDTTAAAGVTYYYWVRAANAAGESAFSAPDTGFNGYDTDGDGLSDAGEGVYGTDPTRADTDGDGFNDGVEVAWGSNPLSAESVPSGNLAVRLPDGNTVGKGGKWVVVAWTGATALGQARLGLHSGTNAWPLGGGTVASPSAEMVVFLPRVIPVLGVVNGQTTGLYRVSVQQAGIGTGQVACGVSERFPVAPDVSGDFSGDGTADVTVYFPPWGMWYQADLAGRWMRNIQFGWNGPDPVPADYDGDGKTDLGVYYGPTAVWYLLCTRAGFGWVQFGWAETRPVRGDFDGDGWNDLAVYHETSGTWYIASLRGYSMAWGMAFGGVGMEALSGDVDGDGLDDLVLYDRGSGTWYARRVTGEALWWGYQFGSSAMIPVLGDYDGDGKADVAVYDRTTGDWFFSMSGGGVGRLNFGWNGPLPVPADYDGDGRDDLAVFYGPEGMWYLLMSTAGYLPVQFGWNGTRSAVK